MKLTKQPTETSPPVLLTTAGAAQYLGLSAKTLNNWRCLGGHRGPSFVRAGRAVRYDRRTLDAWITGNTYASTSAADHASADMAA